MDEKIGIHYAHILRINYDTFVHRHLERERKRAKKKREHKSIGIY